MIKKLKKTLSKYIKVPNKKLIIIYAVSLSVLIAGFIALYCTVGKELTAFITDKDAFKLWLEKYNNLSALIFVLIRAFQTVIKIIPAEPLEIAAGYIWGTWGGLGLCSLGSFIGSVVIILLSKWLGTKFVHTFVNEEQLNELSLISDKKRQRLFLAIFYLVPSTPKDIMTYVAGSLNINMVEFMLITTVARVPSIITSTICGDQLGKSNFGVAIAVFAATAVVSVICGMIYKKYQDKNKSKNQ